MLCTRVAKRYRIDAVAEAEGAWWGRYPPRALERTSPPLTQPHAHTKALPRDVRYVYRKVC